MSRKLHIDKGFFHIIELWAEEYGSRMLEKKVYNNKEVEKELKNLALDEDLVQENGDIETNGERVDISRVLIAESLKKEYGVISECLLMRKLKCTRSEACSIMMEFVSRESALHNSNYQT